MSDTSTALTGFRFDGLRWSLTSVRKEMRGEECNRRGQRACLVSTTRSSSQSTLSRSVSFSPLLCCLLFSFPFSRSLHLRGGPSSVLRGAPFSVVSGNPWARSHWTNLGKVSSPIPVLKAKGMEYANWQGFEDMSILAAKIHGCWGRGARSSNSSHLNFMD